MIKPSKLEREMFILQTFDPAHLKTK